MKQKERRHLKENELAHSVVVARDALAAKKRQISIGPVIGFIVVASAAGFFIVAQRTQARAQDLLAEALVVLSAPVQPATQPVGGGASPPVQAPGTYPSDEARLTAALPKLQATADAYPNSESGISARYYMASSLAELGRFKEAVTAYDAVIAAGGDSLHGRMARLGKAEAQANLGQYEPAIATYKELAEQPNSDMPMDAVLIQLARTYAAAGNREEAQKAFSRIVHEHPTSPFSAEAGKAIAN